MDEQLARKKFPTPVDRATVAADWQARGYSCGLLGAATRYPPRAADDREASQDGLLVEGRRGELKTI